MPVGFMIRYAGLLVCRTAGIDIPACNRFIAVPRGDPLRKTAFDCRPDEDREFCESVHADALQRVGDSLVGKSFGDAVAVGRPVKRQVELKAGKHFLRFQPVKVTAKLGITHRLVESRMSGQRPEIGKTRMSTVENPDLGFLIGIDIRDNLDAGTGQQVIDLMIWLSAQSTLFPATEQRSGMQQETTLISHSSCQEQPTLSPSTKRW